MLYRPPGKIPQNAGALQYLPPGDEELASIETPESPLSSSDQSNVFPDGIAVVGGAAIDELTVTGEIVADSLVVSSGADIAGGATVDELTATGAISGNTLEATVADGTAPLIITSTTKVDNLNVDRVDDAQASATPAAATIPISDANGKLPAGWGGNASTLATLNASSLVVENPANATATPTASKIPIADGSGKLDGWITPVSNKESHVFLLLETVVI